MRQNAELKGVCKNVAIQNTTIKQIHHIGDEGK